jgi:hypothetical protein
MATKTKKDVLGVFRSRGVEVAVMDWSGEIRGRLTLGTLVQVKRGNNTNRYFLTTDAVWGMSVWFVIEGEGLKEKLRRASNQEIARASRLFDLFSNLAIAVAV